MLLLNASWNETGDFDLISLESDDNAFSFYYVKYEGRGFPLHFYFRSIPMDWQEGAAKSHGSSLVAKHLPEPKAFSKWALALDVGVAIALIAIAAVLCESLIRRREARKT
jgi:hypothetical protein